MSPMIIACIIGICIFIALTVIILTMHSSQNHRDSDSVQDAVSTKKHIKFAYIVLTIITIISIASSIITPLPGESVLYAISRTVYIILLFWIFYYLHSDGKYHKRGMKKWYFFCLIAYPIAFPIYLLTRPNMRPGEKSLPIFAILCCIIGFFTFFYTQSEKDNNQPPSMECTIPSGSLLAKDTEVFYNIQDYSNAGDSTGLKMLAASGRMIELDYNATAVIKSHDDHTGINYVIVSNGRYEMKAFYVLDNSINNVHEVKHSKKLLP